MDLEFDTEIKPWKYIQKYKYVLDSIPQAKVKSHDKEYIWQLWLQGEKYAPPIVKKCFESVRRTYPDKELIVLDIDTMYDYVDIPDFIALKTQQDKISRAHFSDYLRVCLLSQYGGTWIDSTVYLTGKIDEEILNSDFFMYKAVSWALFSKTPSEKMLEHLPNYNLLDWVTHKKQSYKSKNTILAGSSWLLNAKANNVIINALKALMEEYWQNEEHIIDYFLFHYFISLAVINNDECRACFDKMPTVSNLLSHFLHKQLYTEFDIDLYNEIKSLSTVHKLTYKGLDLGYGENSFINYILHSSD